MGFEGGSVCLYICNAFNKVWHQKIIFKLRQNGTSVDQLYLS